MKTFNKLVILLCGFCMHVALLIGSIDIAVSQKAFYEYEYKKGNQAQLIGMSEEGLMDTTTTLLDYVKDKKDNIIVETEVNGYFREVFDERETIHMIDVKKLYQKANLVKDICIFITIICVILLYFIDKNHIFKSLKKAFKKGMIILFALILFVSIYAIVDFNSFWLNFHYLFFDNDLFFLDPNVSIMINMFPESFFFDMVILIIVLYILSAFIIYKLTDYLRSMNND